MSLINATDSSSNDVTDVAQINQETMQEFLQKITVWDFFEIRKDEFTSKSDTDKQQLIIRYYNALQSGISLLFVLFLVQQ